MTRTQIATEIEAKHSELLLALNIFGGTIEFSPAWVDRHDGNGIVRAGGIMMGLSVHSPSEKLRSVASSLVFRFESLRYHMEVVLDQRDEFEALLKAEGTEALRNNLHYTSHFIFDDILFNTCSLLDYLAALILGVLQKHGRIQPGVNGILERQFDWGYLCKTIGSLPPNTCLDPSVLSISSIITKEDKAYLGKLFAYRNQVIHSHTRPSPFNVEGQYILIPNSFVSEVGFDKLPGKHNRISMADGTMDIIGRVTTSVVSIMKEATTCLISGNL